MFDNFFKYISENGVGSLVGAVALYFILILGNKLIKKAFSDKSNTHINSSIPLIEHPFFSFLNEAIHYKIASMSFTSIKKKEVFTIYYKIVYKTMYNRYKKLMNDDRILIYNNGELKTVLLNEIRSVVDEYNAKAREIGIPDILINKISNEYSIHLASLAEEVSSIIDNPYYLSNYSKITAVLNLYKFSTSAELDAAKTQLDLLNGELEAAIVDLKLLSIIL